jgi:S1-C subfamily serine protease
MADDSEALDAYSRAVVRVAESVLPSVASLRVRTRRGDGAGSASVLTADGFLLTSAHVVEGSDGAEAAFTDGTVAGVGVGLAVPINDTTREIITTLMAHGRVRRAWLGIVGAQRPLPPAMPSPASSWTRELALVL